MARSSQTAQGSKSVWHQHKFVDHAGREATSVRRLTEHSDGSSDASDPFPFQIYSTLPLDGDLTKLVEYVGKGILMDGFSPSWEIYLELPDVSACVEHQRKEIAHRKTTSQASQAALSSESLPLIPKVVMDSLDPFRQGFFILITSDSYRDGSAPQN